MTCTAATSGIGWVVLPWLVRQWIVTVASCGLAEARLRATLPVELAGAGRRGRRPQGEAEAVMAEMADVDMAAIQEVAGRARRERAMALFAEAQKRLAALSSTSAEPERRRRPRNVPPAPVLDTLPRITQGPHKGERWMSPRDFAGHCRRAVATIYDWLHTGRIRPDDIWKDGDHGQSRVRIASGARERLGKPVSRKTNKKS